MNDRTITNIGVPNYQFFYTNSKTEAGGTALYISDKLHALNRPDIKLQMSLVESCCAEIICNKTPNIIVGCIYKHPSANISDFTLELENIIKKLNENKYVYIMGDINIDLMKCLYQALFLAMHCHLGVK